MAQKNVLMEMIEKRMAGIHAGVPSFCCANKFVIEAILDQAKRFDDRVLIEATSNQVNQYRGYTGMTPQDFKDFVYEIADKINFDKSKIILGGDHLGPLPWCDKPADVAMREAAELVRLTVLAGYQKIHLDTSMKLGDDPVDEKLSDRVIAERGAYLYSVCNDAYHELLKTNPDAVHPVYVIGSEVPIPGGATDKEEKMQITRREDLIGTLINYKNEFRRYGLEDEFKNIIAVVVQPGVEFGNESIHPYNRIDSYQLCSTLREYPGLVFEAHSTDYQSSQSLREMVQDGLAIIKVGPALTFALREALFALSEIEKAMIPDHDKRANFPEVLEKVMQENPVHWKKYYFEEGQMLVNQRKYGLSDRCRYYFALPEVEAAMDKLIANINVLSIPCGLLHQFLPKQGAKVLAGTLKPEAKTLIKDHIVEVVEDYNYAVKMNYFMDDAFLH